MVMNPHQLIMLMLEKPQALAQLAAAKGVEPPETPEEATERLKDPALSPAERQRLQGIAKDAIDAQPENKSVADFYKYLQGPPQGDQAQTNALGQSVMGPQEQGTKDDNALSSALAGPTAAPPAPPGLSQNPYEAGPPAQSAPAPQPGPDAGAAVGQPQQPQTPQLAPLTQQMMQQTPAQPQPAAVNIHVASPSLNAVPPIPGATPAAAAGGGMDPNALASALAGVGSPSTGGNGNLPRAPNAVAPFNPGALQPQTLAILQALAQGQKGAPNLQALLNGAG